MTREQVKELTRNVTPLDEEAAESLLLACRSLLLDTERPLGQERCAEIAGQNASAADAPAFSARQILALTHYLVRLEET